MDSFDSYQLPSSASGSRLLSESPPHRSTGHGGADLSLSELSLSDRPTHARPFSLLARPQEDPATPQREDREQSLFKEEGQEEAQAHIEQTPAQTREERLRSDLFTLRKLNSAFALYNEALSATESGTEVCLIVASCVHFFKGT
jgi:hypothetical protein